MIKYGEIILIKFGQIILDNKQGLGDEKRERERDREGIKRGIYKLKDEELRETISGKNFCLKTTNFLMS